MKVVLALCACLFAIITFAGRPTVFIGDSIIAGLPVSSNDVNMGKSGDPTSGIAERATQIPLSAKAVFFQGGINDVGNKWDDQIVPNYRVMFDAKPFLAKGYLIGVLPVDESKLAPSWAEVANNKKIANINDQIGELCPKCIRVNVTFPPDSHLPDGIHLNETGYAALRRAIEQAQ